MANWIRYGPLRRLIVKTANALQKDTWLRDKLTDFLYPEDCEITFL